MIRTRLHRILETGSEDDLPSRLFDYFILAMILLNVVAVALETHEAAARAGGRLFTYFERFTIVVFTVEYLLRVWTCVEEKRYSRPLLGRLMFVLSPLGIIDALAVFPFYLGPFVSVDLRFVRIFRVFRLIRVFKLSRYNEASAVIVGILRSKRNELVLAASIMLTVLVLASCLMYYVEHPEYPDEFPSIPATMWWSVATLTTVGYGDVVPKTALGRFLGAVISLLGIGFFALPAGILAAGFSDVMGRSPHRAGRCPRCGAVLSGPPDESEGNEEDR